MNEYEQMTTIQRVLDGEPEIFSALVRHDQGSVLRMAAAITGDAGAAQDLAQDAFDEIDLTLAVMACIQPIHPSAASRYFHSSPLLDGPSVLVGFLRMAFVFFCILAPA